MPFRFGRTAVNAAAGNNRHVRVITDDKGIVNHIIKTGLTQNNGDVNRFVFRPRFDGHDNTRSFSIGFNVDIG